MRGLGIRWRQRCSLADVTVCMTYFQSLSVDNLYASLQSLRGLENLEEIREILLLDNNTGTPEALLQTMVDELRFPISVRLLQFVHGDSERTHAWSTNMVVNYAVSDWIFFTRADYMLDTGILRKFLGVISDRSEDWNGFLSGYVYHLHVDVGRVQQMPWREHGIQQLRMLPGNEDRYMSIDAGVWMLRRSAFFGVGGLEERLSAWGHAQTHFQWKLYATGTEFVIIPEVLFYHPLHAAPRDITVAHEQLAAIGVDIRQMWSRYEGGSPY